MTPATSFAGNTVRGVNERRVQSVPVAGQVLDDKGLPLVGVTVQVKNSTLTTTTDGSGNFSISVPDRKSVLIFTHVGFDRQEVTAGAQLTIHMRNTNASLDQVVVIGYGTQRKVSLTGAVDAVSGAKVVDGRPAQSTIQLLQGESPNLIIQQKSFVPNGNNGGNYNINIRGTGTTGNNSPLIVIDGIIGGDMNTLNPNDIDNISILKDAGSAAIYGSRSANGVILITTKKGRLGGKPQLTYNGIYTDQHSHQQFQPVPEWRNAELKNLSLENSGKPDAYTAAQIQAYKEKGDGNWRLNTILHDAPQVNQNFSLSGGSATSTYFMSFGYYDQESNLTKNLENGAYGIKRYNFRLNQTTTLGKFTTGWNLAYTKTIINEPSVGDPSGLIGDVFRAPLSDSFQDSLGRYTTGFVTSNGLDILRNGGYRYSNNDNIDGSFSGSYNITPELKIRAVFGGNVQANTQLIRYVDLKYYPTGETNAGRQTQDINYKQLATNTQLLAEYTKNFGKNYLNVLVGVANESFKSAGNGVSKSNTDSLLGVPTTGTTIDAGTTNNSYNSLTNTNETSLDSWFGRVSYSYNNKYFIDGTFRADASSNFPSNKRWGYFPSIGASWRVSEEGFMSNYREKVGDLRIRSNYGILGNQSVNPYQYFSTYSTNANAYGFNNQAVAGAIRNLANAGLTWEKAATFDAGADATFLHGALSVGGDFFNKVTSNILAPRQDVPTLFGSPFPTYNVSKVRVRGWEAKISYNLRSANWGHSFSFNISDNLSKLLAYSFGQTENVFQREEFDFVHRVGYPVTVYQGYKTAGLYQNAQDVATAPKFAANTVGPGDWKFVDKNHDGVIDARDKFVLGNPFPRFTFGFTYNVSYKGFDGSVFIQGVLKRVELIRGELIEAYHFGNYGGTAYNTKPETDFWTPQNTGAKYPRLSEIGSAPNTNNFRTGSDMYLFNTAYARLKNIQVGYTLPGNKLSSLGIQKLRVYLTAQNIFTVSPLKFADPEGTEFGNNLDNTSGANSPRSYPALIFYGAGIDVQF